MIRAAPLAVLRLFSSVTFGIVLLSALFAYMAIGSAGILYPVHPNLFHPDSWVHAQMRQWRPFEMTEFEWFHWWPFNTLIALIAATLVTTTLRRIPFKPINYGVWMIHGGIIVLIVGSLIYFGTKVEGEAPVPRRALAIQVRQADGTVVRGSVLAMPGNRTAVETPGGTYQFDVQDIDPGWSLLSGPDAGKKAYSVNVLVRTPARRFIRQVIAEYPQYTEDLIMTQDPKQPMKRAVKETGNPIVDEQVVVDLVYEGQGWFYLKNDLNKSWALYARRPGQTEWIQQPIEGLPLYNDYISSLDDVHSAQDSGLTPDPMCVPIALQVPGGAGASTTPVKLECTGFLRYAQERARWVPGSESDPENPVISLSVRNREGVTGTYRLVARDPAARSAVNGMLAMRQISDESQMATLQTEPSLVLRIPGAGVEVKERVRDVLSAQPDAPFKPMGPAELGYSYRVASVQDGLPVGGRELSVAIVELRTPKGAFRRWAFDDAALTRDMAEGESPEQAVAHGPRHLIDESVQVEYMPGNGLARVMVVVGPGLDQIRLIDAMDTRSVRVLPLAASTPTDIANGSVTVVVNSYMPRAVLQRKPYPVPQEQRIRDAREMLAMAKIGEVGQPGVWLSYHPYVFDRPEDALFRYALRPTTVTLKDGSELELLFSRRREKLGSPIALQDFELATNVGGFSGATSSIRNYTSVVRFGNADGTWGPAQALSVNEPVEHDGLWFFQSQWDPPQEAREGGLSSAGLNYTVLGVGNRHGVWVQLAGCMLSAVGMAYAFYVKPIIRRRQKEEVLREIASATSEGRAPRFGGHHALAEEQRHG